jgi:hypothetical protein
MKWSEVKLNEVKWNKWSEVKGDEVMWSEWILETIYSTFLTGCCLPYCTCCMLSCHVKFDVSFKCLVFIVVRWIVCMVVAVLCILWSSYVYLLYWGYWCFTLDAGLLARSQYSEGPATGHLDTGFSWFPLCLKANAEMVPKTQVATTCFSCGPTDVNLVAN